MTNSFNGQVAIITGAGRGIGAATARLLASQGARVAILSRTQAELEGVAKAIASAHGKDSVLAIATDVTLEASVKGAFERVRAAWGPITILVNNAGAIANQPITEMTLETWERIQAVNVRGAFLCSREAFLQMRDSGKGGSIVNLSSLGGIRSTQKFPGFSAYTAAKHAVVGLTEVLAVEGKPLGIRVNCVAPGAVDTQMLREAAPGLKTNTKPEAIAEVIAYLCDPERSRALTGAVIEANTNE